MFTEVKPMMNRRRDVTAFKRRPNCSRRVVVCTLFSLSEEYRGMRWVGTDSLSLLGLFDGKGSSLMLKAF